MVGLTKSSVTKFWNLYIEQFTDSKLINSTSISDTIILNLKIVYILSYSTPRLLIKNKLNCVHLLTPLLPLLSEYLINFHALTVSS